MVAHKYYIENSSFVQSVHTPEQMKQYVKPHVAFVGRSNVGKSSLVNFILSRKELARVSRTPGRTQGINVYEASIGRKSLENPNDKETKQFLLFDLPGLGFAKHNKSIKEEMSRIVTSYLKQDQEMRAVFHLLDCRRKPNEEDIELSRTLRELNDFYCVILTKIDHVVVSKRKPLIKEIESQLDAIGAVVGISSNKQIGREDLLERIWDVCE